MDLATLVPLSIALVLTVLLTGVHGRLPPALAAQSALVTMGVVVAAATSTFWAISFGYVTHLPVFGGRLDWCSRAVGVHEPVATWIGVPAVAVVIAGLVRSGTALRSFRALRRDCGGDVEIADHPRPFAFTLPGPGGQIVLSTALVELLDPRERDVVVAHELAHAQHRHDRYLLASQLAEALVPLLRPIATRLRFSLERWADEAAVDECGDRRLVAQTLCRVALGDPVPAFAAGFNGLGVTARTRALLSPMIGPARASTRFVLWASIAFTSMVAVWQIHHTVELVIAICLH